MEQRISLITLGVRDLPRARAFYQAMGFTPAGGDEHVCFFQLGPLGLSLFGWNSLADDAKIPAQGEGFRGVSLAYNVRTKEEVAPILADAARAGGRIVKPADDVFWGGHSGYFADPDGHLWEVAWNPGFPIGSDGALTIKFDG
ncbi:MAG: VOC family protein [Caulobacterales bacterium]